MPFKYGDILENGRASVNNPQRIGIFVKRVKRGFEMTDGKGNFWVTAIDNHRLVKIGEAIKAFKWTTKAT